MSPFIRRPSSADLLEDKALLKSLRRARARTAALERARVHGPVRIPDHWPTPATPRYLPQTAAYVGTRFVPVPREPLPPMAMTDALAALAPIEFRPPTGFELRRLAGDGMTSGTHRTAALRAPTPEVGSVVATVTAWTTADRGHSTTTQELAVVDEVIDGGYTSPTSAIDAATRLAHETDDPRPIAVLGTRLARLRMPAHFVAHAAGAPLVGFVQGTDASLGWTATNAALVAVVGVDGVRYL